MFLTKTFVKFDSCKFYACIVILGNYIYGFWWTWQDVFLVNVLKTSSYSTMASFAVSNDIAEPFDEFMLNCHYASILWILALIIENIDNVLLVKWK